MPGYEPSIYDLANLQQMQTGLAPLVNMGQETAQFNRARLMQEIAAQRQEQQDRARAALANRYALEQLAVRNEFDKGQKEQDRQQAKDLQTMTQAAQNVRLVQETLSKMRAESQKQAADLGQAVVIEKLRGKHSKETAEATGRGYADRQREHDEAMSWNASTKLWQSKNVRTQLPGESKEHYAAFAHQFIRERAEANYAQFSKQEEEATQALLTATRAADARRDAKTEQQAKSNVGIDLKRSNASLKEFERKALAEEIARLEPKAIYSGEDEMVLSRLRKRSDQLGVMVNEAADDFRKYGGGGSVPDAPAADLGGEGLGVGRQTKSGLGLPDKPEAADLGGGAGAGPASGSAFARIPGAPAAASPAVAQFDGALREMSPEQQRAAQRAAMDAIGAKLGISAPGFNQVSGGEGFEPRGPRPLGQGLGMMFRDFVGRPLSTIFGNTDQAGGPAWSSRWGTTDKLLRDDPRVQQAWASLPEHEKANIFYNAVGPTQGPPQNAGAGDPFGFPIEEMGRPVSFAPPPTTDIFAPPQPAARSFIPRPDPVTMPALANPNGQGLDAMLRMERSGAQPEPSAADLVWLDYMRRAGR